ncbi:TPA: hypothetical protein ACH3X3_000747 [Trebouxia sp. C0006]
MLKDQASAWTSIQAPQPQLWQSSSQHLQACTSRQALRAQAMKVGVCNLQLAQRAHESTISVEFTAEQPSRGRTSSALLLAIWSSAGISCPGLAELAREASPAHQW